VPDIGHFEKKCEEKKGIGKMMPEGIRYKL
jgi:hypothetical protein